MLEAINELTALRHLGTMLEIAADRCQWTASDFEELKSGTLPARTLEHPASSSVAVIIKGFPRMRVDFEEEFRRFGAERLGEIAEDEEPEELDGYPP
jgi:hypothetical protein